MSDISTAIRKLRLKKMWGGGCVKGYASGGEVASDKQDDDLDVMGHYNTSGEPHTDGMDEIEHPMEFMAEGGEVDTDDEDEAYPYEPSDYPGKSTMDVTPGDFAADFYHSIKTRQRRFG